MFKFKFYSSSCRDDNGSTRKHHKMLSRYSLTTPTVRLQRQNAVEFYTCFESVLKDSGSTIPILIYHTSAKSLQFNQLVGLLLLHLAHLDGRPICRKDFGAVLEILAAQCLRAYVMTKVMLLKMCLPTAIGHQAKLYHNI